MTREEWWTLIQGQTVHCFAGTPFRKPNVGDTVEVLSGKEVGAIYEVVAVVGNAYRSDNRIYVDHPSGIPTWYFPWDLRVLEKKET